jgi:hypothetical protein
MPIACIESKSISSSFTPENLQVETDFGIGAQKACNVSCVKPQAARRKIVALYWAYICSHRTCNQAVVSWSSVQR